MLEIELETRCQQIWDRVSSTLIDHSVQVPHVDHKDNCENNDEGDNDHIIFTNKLVTSSMRWQASSTILEMYFSITFYLLIYIVILVLITIYCLSCITYCVLSLLGPM